MTDPGLREQRRVMMERLRTNPRDPEAAGAFLALLDAIGARLSFDATVLEDAKDRVISEIYAKIHAGTLKPIQFPWTFLRKRVYWRALDVIDDARPKVQKPAPPPKPRCPFEADVEVELLKRAYDLARRLREPHHRPPLEEAWARCAAWHEGPHTMTELVAQECAAAGITDSARIKTEYDRQTRAQSRLREALRGAVDELEESGKLSPTDAAFAQNLIERLARCPKERPTGVQGAP